MTITVRKHIHNGLFAVVTFVLTAFLWEYPLLLASILALSGAFVAFKKRLIPFWIAHGVLGALAETIAIAFGAWQYTSPDIIGIPLWLPFLWGNASLYIIVSYKISKHVRT